MDRADVERGAEAVGEGAEAGSEAGELGAGKMTVRLKLYASLGVYLPAGAARNEASVTAAPGTTARQLLDRHGVPPEACHLVLVNGVYQAPAARETAALKDGDSLAVWPPVAGG